MSGPGMCLCEFEFRAPISCTACEILYSACTKESLRRFSFVVFTHGYTVAVEKSFRLHDWCVHTLMNEFFSSFCYTTRNVSYQLQRRLEFLVDNGSKLFSPFLWSASNLFMALSKTFHLWVRRARQEEAKKSFFFCSFKISLQNLKPQSASEAKKLFYLWSHSMPITVNILPKNLAQLSTWIV